MRVLVTGGAGYIGSHTAKVLARVGHQPVVFDDLSTGHRHNVRWGPLIEGSLEDGALLRRILLAEKIEAVIHFAASAYVGESVTNPRKYFRNNAANTLTLLEAMLDTNVQQIVLSSTCAVYGTPVNTPITENHPTDPINPYGESKLFVEKVLRWYGSAYPLRWVALRYFNAAGADPEGEIGERHVPETHVIPLVLDVALGRRPHFEVFGKDYPTVDGTAVRDYVHVTDLADAHVSALDYLCQARPSIVLNLGTGQGTSVREIISGVERIGNCTIPVHFSGRRSGDPAVLVANNSLSISTLGCEYKNSSLETILQTAWDWHKAQR